MDENLVIGIDFGTTNCCVSVFCNNEIKVIENVEGDRTTPSYLFFQDNNEIVVGKFAKGKAENVPKNGIYDMKRLVGRKFDDPDLQKLLKYLTYEVTKDEDNDPVVTIKQNGKSLKKTIVDLCCILFQKLKSAAESRYKIPLNNVVVTVPAYFKMKQRQAIMEAATKAGFSVIKLLNEPTAAALCYYFEQSRDIDDTGYSVVYDLGGGTFDVAVLKKTKNNIQVISVGGDPLLGGDDFDNLIQDYVCDEVMANYKYSLRGNKSNMNRLRKICQEVKHALSTTNDFEIILTGFVDRYNSITIPLTRQKFEELANGLFEKTIHAVDECLKNSNIDKHTIQEIILAGGSTRIPKIQKMLSEYFNGRRLCKFVNPDECVANGAALQAAMLSKHPNQEIRKFNLIDVIPLSIGIADFVGRMEFLIKRNTPIPCKVKKSFVTTQHQQPKVELKVYEGERLDVRKNRCIAALEISDITSAPAGECEITVEMIVDKNGILTITAREELKKIVKELKVTHTRGDKSEFEIKDMILDAEKMRIEDEEFAKLAEARARLIDYCNNVIKNLTKKGIADKHASLVQMCERYKSKGKTNSFDKSLSDLEKSIKRVQETCGQLFN